jgi:hypothetical protein
VTVIGATPSSGPEASTQHLSTFLHYCRHAHTLLFLRSVFSAAMLDCLSTMAAVQRLVLHGAVDRRYWKHPGVFTAAYARLWQPLASLREAIVWLGSQVMLPLPLLPPTLHTLCLQHCAASATEIQLLLDSHGGLRRLALHGIGGDDVCRAVMAHGARLACLELWDSGVGAEAAAALGSLGALGSVALDLRKTPDAQPVLAALARCGSLTALRLNGSHTLRDADMRRLLLTAGRRLRVLDLNFCSGLTDSTAITVSQMCPALTHFAVAGTKITADGVGCVAKACKRLAAVDMQSRVGPPQSALLKLVLASALPRVPCRRVLAPGLPHIRFAEADRWGFADSTDFPGSDALVQRVVVHM